MRQPTVCLFALLIAAGGGCSSDSTGGGSGGGGGGYGSDSGAVGPGGGGFGVTPGGAQDIGYARDVIGQGGVPEAKDIRTEGLLSEHDLATIGPPCHELICLRPAVAIAPDLTTGDVATWLHVGMASGLADDFQRPPLDLSVLIDKSGSMSGDMAETTYAASKLIDQLRDEDRIEIVAFDTSLQIIHPFGPVTDKAALKAAVEAVGADGSWDLQKAVDHGYATLEEASGLGERLRRVIVMSCGYPIIDSGFDDSFSGRVRLGADQGVGMSFVGVLLGYSENLADLLGATKGGSYHYTYDLPSTEQAFGEDFITMVTPVAYDMDLSFSLGDAFEVDRFFGLPSADPGEGEGEGGGSGGGSGTGGADPGNSAPIATGFLSRRGGGIVARLNRVDVGNHAGDLSLSYTPELAFGYDGPVEDLKSVTIADPNSQPFFESEGVRKSVALVNMAERMKAACTTYHDGDAVAAILILDELIAYFESEATILADADLQSEVELLEALRDNMAP